MQSDLNDLVLALKSHFPILVFETHDEQRVLHLLKRALIESKQALKLVPWSAAPSDKPTSNINYGVKSIDYENAVSAKEDDPEAFLLSVHKQYQDTIVLLPDFHMFLTNPKILRLVKEIGQAFYEKRVFLVFVSHQFEVPPEIERLCNHIEVTMPDQEHLMEMIKSEAKLWAGKHGDKVKADRKAVELLSQHLVGLTESDAKRLIRAAIYDDGAITHSDVSELMDIKHKFVAKDSAINFEFDTAKFSDVGGFKRLFKWLNVRKSFFLDEDVSDGLDTPKGILLLGVQGCGKSLAAKAVAGEWGVPLLKFDVAALYNKYIGETEKNLRQALHAAEQLAPCVLWIDEIEKAIQGGNDETGTASRVLGTLLTWMAENTSKVFLVATANDVTNLPPELMRKGRIDELFFVDLPDDAARQEIFKVHLGKRNIPCSQDDLSQLISASQGFSGAEIEQAVASARYLAHSRKEETNPAHVHEELSDTKPLSVIRKEDISALRAWAAERCVLI